MAADEQFYREYILDHYKNPRNFGRLEDADISHEEYNPLCGDMVGMDFSVRDGLIEDVRFHGRRSAISQASASLMTERLKGMALEEAREGWERERGHMPGSRHVVFSRILANPGAVEFRDHTIFACEIGERSAVASEMAVALGVKDVVNFRGGHKAWREAGLPLEK